MKLLGRMVCSVPSGDPNGSHTNGGRVDRALGQFYQFALVLTLWITGLGLGMTYGPSQILRTHRRGGLFARAVLLDVVIVLLQRLLTPWTRGVEA